MKIKIKGIDEYIYGKPKGLYNLGLNCYMNSLLQCFYYIKELREYFIENKDKFNEKQKICKEFAEVMYGLKNDEKDYFIPIKLKILLGEINNLFLGVKAGDAKDLFFNLIDIFLTELSNENDNIESNSSIINFNDKKMIFEQNLKETYKNNIINNLLIGYYETLYYCIETKITTYSFQNESFILFELEKIQKFCGTYKFSLESCFNYYYREMLNSSFYCNSCKVVHKGIAYEKIYRPPKILIIILDRGHGKTFKGKVEINKFLDLKNYIDEENYEYSSLYELICVSTHEGESSSSGHYTARCLTDNNKYYYFNDTYVKEINEEDLFKNEPYLLFYKQIDISEKKNEIYINKKDIKNSNDGEINNDIFKKLSKNTEEIIQKNNAQVNNYNKIFMNINNNYIDNTYYQKNNNKLNMKRSASAPPPTPPSSPPTRICASPKAYRHLQAKSMAAALF